MNSFLPLSDIASWPPFRSPNLTLPNVVAGVPSLQRGLVWKPGQVEMLWDSLMRGFPIGALVICKKLPRTAQRTKHVKDDEDEAKITHHLLDGQQRAQAIGLGFEDPFKSDSNGTSQILWLDLAPSDLGETREFLFRITTMAHPWGYATNDTASPVGIALIRSSLDECKAGCGDDLLPLRPKPKKCRPIAARAPVPFAWIMNSAARDASELWAEIHARCMGLMGQVPEETWARQAMNFLTTGTNRDSRDAIWNGLQLVREARIICLEVPEKVLAAETHRENSSRDEDHLSDNVTNVEHLFHRLNRGGTRLDGDDLAYSMIKAHWRNLEPNIRELAKERKLPEARLVTLAARLPFGTALDANDKPVSRKISTPVSVSDIRRLAYAGKKGNQERFENFFASDGTTGLAAILTQKVKKWFEGPGDYNLPLVLQTSIARESRDVYALLLWLADRALRESTEDESLRKPIQGLLTALHWFAWNKAKAVDTVVSILDNGPLNSDSFKGILVRAHAGEGQQYFRLPLSVQRFEDGIPLTSGPPASWGCWAAIRSKDEATRDAIGRVMHEREFLLYAQRKYLRSRFGTYDPAMEETWAEHNRPWDFDHILPKAKINYRQFQYKDAVKEWALQSIANERAWPMEANRSDCDEAPQDKFATNEGLRDRFLTDSFITGDELSSFGRGYTATEMISGPTDDLEAFISAARCRLVRIYRSWHDRDGLDIGFLTGAQ